jgi:hypothetical protein
MSSEGDANPSRLVSNIGINIVLVGELSNVVRDKDDETTVFSGAAGQRQHVYSVLDTLGCELPASGECFLANESQQVGALIASAAHDTINTPLSRYMDAQEERL